MVETILELLALVAVATASCFAGHRIAGRNPFQTKVAFAFGVSLMAWTLGPLLWPDRLYFLYPAFAHGPVLFGLGFFLIGVLFRSYCDIARRRILNGVFAVVLTYFVFAEPIHLAIAADEIRALDGGVRDGVSIQAVNYTCMPASLATVLRHWGIEVTEGELAYAMRTGFQGTHPARVPQVVADFGKTVSLRARVVSTSVDELSQASLPAIVLGRSGEIRHAVALLEIDRHRVVVGDPLHGRQTMETKTWEQAFRPGEAILVERASATSPR